jgi:hypothetical protein
MEENTWKSRSRREGNIKMNRKDMLRRSCCKHGVETAVSVKKKKKKETGSVFNF